MGPGGRVAGLDHGDCGVAAEAVFGAKRFWNQDITELSAAAPAMFALRYWRGPMKFGFWSVPLTDWMPEA